MDIPITDSVAPTASAEPVRVENSPTAPTDEGFADALQPDKLPSRPTEEESAQTALEEDTTRPHGDEADRIVGAAWTEPDSPGKDLTMIDQADPATDQKEHQKNGFAVAVQSRTNGPLPPDGEQTSQSDRPTKPAIEVPPAGARKGEHSFPHTQAPETAVDVSATAEPDSPQDAGEARQGGGARQGEARQTVLNQTPTALSERNKHGTKKPQPKSENTTPAAHEPSTGPRAVAAQSSNLVTALIQSTSPQDPTHPNADTNESSQNVSRTRPVEQAQGEKGDARPNSPAERVPDHLLASGNTTSRQRIELTRADQARFVQRVARAIQAAPQRGGTLRMRLHPPELGSLSLEVTIERGVLSARLEAETQAARTVLLENLPQLKERLTEQGLRIDQFEVDISKQETGERSQQFLRADTPHSNGDLAEDPLPDDRGDSAPGRPDLQDRTLNVVI